MLKEEGEDRRPRQEMEQEWPGESGGRQDQADEAEGDAAEEAQPCGSQKTPASQQGCSLRGESRIAEFRETLGLRTTPLRGLVVMRKKENMGGGAGPREDEEGLCVENSIRGREPGQERQNKGQE